MSRRDTAAAVAAVRDLERVHAGTSSELSAALRPHDLKPWMYDVLAALAGAAEHSLHIHEIAARVYRDKSTLTRSIRKLADRGLLEQHRGTDGRRRLVVLSPAGEQLQAAVRPAYEAAARGAVSRWPAPAKPQPVVESRPVEVPPVLVPLTDAERARATAALERVLCMPVVVDGVTRLEVDTRAAAPLLAVKGGTPGYSAAITTRLAGSIAEHLIAAGERDLGNRFRSEQLPAARYDDGAWRPMQ